MLLEIVDIHNKGDASKEFVQMRANEACKLDHFILADSTYKNPIIKSNKLRHMYWWKTGEVVKKGDYVFVFTREGKDSVHTDALGTVSHYFYWNLKEPVWNDTGDLACLFQLHTWQLKVVGPAK